VAPINNSIRNAAVTERFASAANRIRVSSKVGRPRAHIRDGLRTWPNCDEAGQPRDAPEEKVDTENFGPMHGTGTVQLCLFAIRGHLLLMFGLLGFRVLQLAGTIRP
jgi:hypothetical protein